MDSFVDLKALFATGFQKNKEKNWPAAEESYKQILDALPDNKSAANSLAWVYWNWNKELLEHVPNTVSKIKSNLHCAIKLKCDKPSDVYSRLLQQALKLQENQIDMFTFLDMWGFDFLRAEDWGKTSDGKREWDGTAIRAIRAAIKSVINQSNPPNESVEKVLNWTDLGLQKYPNDVWLAYFKGKLFLQVGQSDEAAECFKSVANAKNSEWWIWWKLGTALQDTEPSSVLACYCRAASLKIEDDKSLGLRYDLIQCLVKSNYLKEANIEANNVFRIAREFDLKLAPRIQDLVFEPWYQKDTGNTNNISFYKERAKEAFDILTEDLSWIPANIGSKFETRQGKTRIEIITEMDSYQIPENAFDTSNLNPGCPIQIKIYRTDGVHNKVLNLRPRKDGSIWDQLPEQRGIVDNINPVKALIHVILHNPSNPESPKDIIASLNDYKHLGLKVGDGVRVRTKNYKQKTFVVTVKKDNVSDLADLIKTDVLLVTHIDEERRFGKLEDGSYLPRTFLEKHPECVEDKTFKFVLIRNKNRTTDKWGWMAIKLA